MRLFSSELVIFFFISSLFYSVKTPTIGTQNFRFELHPPASFISCLRSYFHHKFGDQPSQHERLTFKGSGVIQKQQAIPVVWIHGSFDNRLRRTDPKCCVQLPVWRTLPLWIDISLGTGLAAVSRQYPGEQRFEEAGKSQEEVNDTITRQSLSESISCYAVYFHKCRYCPGGVARDIFSTTAVLHMRLFRSSFRQWGCSGQCNATFSVLISAGIDWCITWHMAHTIT